MPSQSSLANGAGGPAAARLRAGAIGPVRVRADRLTSDYCNAISVNSTRDEVVLTFGLNDDWDRGQRPVNIALLTRIILGPHGARRLNERLGRVLREYEVQFRGQLK